MPFVDALTTILDPSLPLTVTEWEEWGNPLDDPEVYALHEVATRRTRTSAAVDYPPILAITSLNDTRVLYVEPAKWVARLRAAVDRSRSADPAQDRDGRPATAASSGRYDALARTGLRRTPGSSTRSGPTSRTRPEITCSDGGATRIPPGTRLRILEYRRQGDG